MGWTVQECKWVTACPLTTSRVHREHMELVLVGNHTLVNRVCHLGVGVAAGSAVNSRIGDADRALGAIAVTELDGSRFDAYMTFRR